MSDSMEPDFVPADRLTWNFHWRVAKAIDSQSGKPGVLLKISQLEPNVVTFLMFTPEDALDLVAALRQITQQT